MAKKQQQFVLMDLVQKSNDSDVPVVYANQARIAVTHNEIFIDFILLAPGYKTDDPAAKVVQRMVLPLAQGANFMKAFLRVMPAAEKELAEGDLVDVEQLTEGDMPVDKAE